MKNVGLCSNQLCSFQLTRNFYYRPQREYSSTFGDIIWSGNILPCSQGVLAANKQLIPTHRKTEGYTFNCFQHSAAAHRKYYARSVTLLMIQLCAGVREREWDKRGCDFTAATTSSQSGNKYGVHCGVETDLFFLRWKFVDGMNFTVSWFTRNS